MMIIFNHNQHIRLIIFEKREQGKLLQRGYKGNDEKDDDDNGDEDEDDQEGEKKEQ